MIDIDEKEVVYELNGRYYKPKSKMKTLEEAIKYHEELSKDDPYQKQLVEWLKELQYLRVCKSFAECPDTMGR